jgi:hypothetical protein
MRNKTSFAASMSLKAPWVLTVDDSPFNRDLFAPVNKNPQAQPPSSVGI